MGMTLPRPSRVRLNRLRTSVGLFRSTLHKWGLVPWLQTAAFNIWWHKIGPNEEEDSLKNVQLCTTFAYNMLFFINFYLNNIALLALWRAPSYESCSWSHCKQYITVHIINHVSPNVVFNNIVKHNLNVYVYISIVIS